MFTNERHRALCAHLEKRRGREIATNKWAASRPDRRALRNYRRYMETPQGFRLHDSARRSDERQEIREFCTIAGERIHSEAPQGASG